MDLKKIDQFIDNKLSEGKEVPEAFLEKIRKMTDINDHTNARLEVAKFLKNKKLIKIYKAIQDIQDELGFLPNGISDTRYQIDKDFLYPSAVKKLGKQGSSQIYSSL